MPPIRAYWGQGAPYANPTQPARSCGLDRGLRLTPGDDATPMGPPSVDHEDGLADPLDETAPDADPEPETDGDSETDSDSNTDPGPEADPETDTDSDQADGFTRVSSIDDACDALDPGYGSATDDAVEAIDRTNCYRNLMGLERGLLDPDLDAASQIHADYMDRHDTLTHWEDPSKALYTGEWVCDLKETAVYPVEPGQSWSGSSPGARHRPRPSISGSAASTTASRSPCPTGLMPDSVRPETSSMSFVTPSPTDHGRPLCSPHTVKMKFPHRSTRTPRYRPRAKPRGG